MRYLFVAVLVVLLALNGLLLWQNHALKQIVAETNDSTPSHLIMVEGEEVDVRGMYTYPGIGRIFLPKDSADIPIAGSMNLVVFLSAATTCPASMSEVRILAKLKEKLDGNSQTIVAVTSQKDSVAVSNYLATEKLDVPLLVYDESQGYTFEQMGISPQFMPFKVIYDSTGSAVYMRGADNSPESQQGFEQAVVRLSDFLAGA